MPELKLPRLPDRNPVKITITVRPELNAALRAYAELYRESYGDEETVAELIPYMLESFLESDRNFARAMKDKDSVETAVPPSRSRRRSDGDSASPKS
jgi:hypothetical protein